MQYVAAKLLLNYLAQPGRLIKACRWIEKLVWCQSVAKALAPAMEAAPAMAERRFRSADIFPDEVAETCPGRYGGEAEVQTRVASPFELAARKDGQGERYARDRSCFAQYRNNGFAAHRR
jgi:hypothetical protein